MTLVECVIAAHAHDAPVHVAHIVKVDVDLVYLQDGNTPTVARLFQQFGFTSVADPQRIAVFFDHAVLAPDARISTQVADAMAFARALGVRVYPPGTGISHVVAVEQGLVRPGALVVGADSHTCSAGTVQCLGLGMGASDVVAAMVTGQTWLRVPDTVWVQVNGRPSAAAGPKDFMLFALSRFGQDTLLYRSIEWSGAWLEQLTLDGASTVANMTVELGAKCSFLPPGPGRPAGMRTIDPPSDRDATVHTVNIDGLPPYVACPSSPDNGVPLDECAGQKIDYVFIGSCANSRWDDLVDTARVLKGRTIHPSVQCVVTPGSRDLYLRAVREGLVDSIVAAGALFTPAGCGSCVGTQGIVPWRDCRVLSTMNRNFIGRMGNPTARIWLSSPIIAAYTSLMGEIPRTSDVDAAA